MPFGYNGGVLQKCRAFVSSLALKFNLLEFPFYFSVGLRGPFSSYFFGAKRIGQIKIAFIVNGIRLCYSLRPASALPLWCGLKKNVICFISREEKPTTTRKKHWKEWTQSTKKFQWMNETNLTHQQLLNFLFDFRRFFLSLSCLFN